MISASVRTKSIEEDLLLTFRRALNRPNFKSTEGFLNSGGDSLTVIETILDIESQYGVTLSASEFMALDTAESLAPHIASMMHQAESEAGNEPMLDTEALTMLSVIQQGEGNHVIIFAYGVKGHAAFAIKAAKMFPAEQPIAALQIRPSALEKNHSVHSLRALAAHDAENILRQYPKCSFTLVGYSLGAHVALAVGQELTHRGSPPALLAILDDEADLIRRYFPEFGTESQTQSMEQAIVSAYLNSPAEPLCTTVIYFRSAENQAYYRSDPTSGWGEVATGGVEIYNLPFNHQNFLSKSCLRQIAPLLLGEIKKQRPPAPRESKVQKIRFEARSAGRKGNLTKELSLIKKAIEQDENQPAWLYAQLAQVYFKKGDQTLALEALLQARLRENWQLSLDLYFLPELQKPALKAERAELFHRLATMTTDHQSVHEQKARVYFRLGHYAKCARELKRGLAIQPSHLRLSKLAKQLENLKSDLSPWQRFKVLIAQYT